MGFKFIYGLIWFSHMVVFSIVIAMADAFAYALSGYHFVFAAFAVSVAIRWADRAADKLTEDYQPR